MERTGLSVLDWVVVGGYLGAVLLLGLRAGGRQRTTRDYFLGDRSLPWWAVALSIIATETSAATYVGTPGIAYRASWHYLQMVLGFVLARVFLALFFIGVYYRADVVTVYGFLRQRFGEGARVCAALLFVCGRVIGSGVRLYAASVALGVAAGWAGGESAGRTAFLVIAALGLLALLYTLLGGIKAVVWTECALGVTFLLGGVVAAAFILARIPGGLEAAASLPDFAEKLRIFHLAPPAGAGWLSSVEPLWIGLAGGFVLNLATHGTDQDMVQRMLACPDWKKGGKSLIASAALILPLNVVFLLVGSLLYFHHRLRPESVPPGVQNPDDYFLLFIAREMPAGLAGLVLSGLLAAAVSSHTSVLNALSSTSIADFYRPHLVKGADEGHYIRASRIFTAFWGVALVLVAAAFIGSRENVLAVALKTLTYFYGSLLGVFLLGIFTRRGTSASATAGMLAAVPVVLLFQLRDFIESPAEAPIVVQKALEALPPAAVGAVRALPRVAWPLWIVAGTAVSFLVGAMASGKRHSPDGFQSDRKTGGSDARPPLRAAEDAGEGTRAGRGGDHESRV